EDDRGRVVRRGRVDAVLNGQRDDSAVTARFQRGAQRASYSRRVLEHEDRLRRWRAHRRCTGKVNTNVAPVPGPSAPRTAIAPPCASTMALQIASPTPLDVEPLPRENGSKMRSRSSGSTPGP